MLAERSQHRAVPLPDLLIAACAEGAELTVLHYDADFERIAKLTEQAVQWGGAAWQRLLVPGPG